MTATREQILEVLSTIQDPDLHKDIVTLGFVTKAEVEGTLASVVINLTTPACPVKDQMRDAAIAKIKALPGIEQVDVEMTAEVRGSNAPRQIAPNIRHFIAVSSGKGGVGKSTVSVNVATALHRMGAKVGLLDADIYGPSVPKMMGEPERPTDKSTSGDRIVPAIHRGMPVMSVDFFVRAEQAVIWRGPMIHKLLQQFLEDVDWGELDYLVLDLPPGTGDAQLSLGQLIPINGGLIVTTPQDVALLDVRKAVSMFEKLDIPVLGVVENMSYYVCPACGHRDNVFSSGGGKRLAGELGVELFGQLPLDAKVAIGGERGIPIVMGDPEGEHARAFMHIAAQVALATSKLAATGPKRSSRLRTV